MVYEDLLMASEWGVMHKLLLGSDFPITTPSFAMERLRDMNAIVDGTNLPNISLEQIEHIIQVDALAALNLKGPRKKI